MRSIFASGDAALLAEKIWPSHAAGMRALALCWFPWWFPASTIEELGAILDFGIQASPVVRGIHIQPVSYFGRRPVLPQNCDRITLPEILTALETQSRGKVRACDFHPPGCENALCSFNGRFFITESGGLKPVVTLPAASAGSPPEAADVGARRAVAAVARQWGAGPGLGGEDNTNAPASGPASGIKAYLVAVAGTKPRPRRVRTHGP